MLDRCQRLFFKNLFYEAACDSKALNCKIIMQKRFFWLLSQLLTNLLSFLLLHNSVISLFRPFFIFPPPPTHFYCFPFSLFLLFCLLCILFISHCFPPPSRPHFYCFPSLFSSFLLFSVPFLLISIVFRPSSPHFYFFPSLFSSFLLSPFSLFLLFSLLLLISVVLPPTPYSPFSHRP